MAKSYKLEQYKVERWGDTFTVTKYTSGGYSCDCGMKNNPHYFYGCPHIDSVVAHTAKIIGARRFSHNERYIR